MSDNFSLIVKNGSCYIDGGLKKTDIGLLNGKIKKIGQIELKSSKVLDATNKLVLPGIFVPNSLISQSPGTSSHRFFLSRPWPVFRENTRW